MVVAEPQNQNVFLGGTKRQCGENADLDGSDRHAVARYARTLHGDFCLAL